MRCNATTCQKQAQLPSPYCSRHSVELCLSHAERTQNPLYKAMLTLCAVKIAGLDSQPAPQPQPATDDARAVLGFGRSTPLTTRLIEERRKELALLFHPDRGGSNEGMQRINAAADALASALDRKD